MYKRPIGVIVMAIFGLSCLNVRAELVVYSARNEQLIKPLFDRFTSETGIEVEYVTSKAGPLLERLKAEGPKTKADVLLTVDAGNLWKAAEEGLLAETRSEVLNENIPEWFRDSKGRWYGLSIRARTIVYSTDRVKPSELSTYEELGSAKWKRRLCLRTSKKVYNQSLIAMMIAEHGEKKTEAIVKSWVANLATDVFSNDTKVMKAILAGQCDLGVVNSYYFGRLKRETPAAKLALFWSNQKKGGVHVNVSGAGVVKHSKNRKEALVLLEWLSSPNAQNLFADSNLEYPANPNIKAHPIVRSWGGFRENRINVSRAGELQRDAIMLMDRAGYR